MPNDEGRTCEISTRPFPLIGRGLFLFPHMPSAFISKPGLCGVIFMSDQGKWFKLWESALDDSELENLSVHEWFCWVRLGAYIKKHGNEGKICFRYPGLALVHLFRMDLFDNAIGMIKRFPNYTVGEREVTVTPVTNETVTYEVECKNWFKYQGDFSGDRVRRFRDKKRHHVTVQEEKRSRREETRREESINTLAQAPKISHFIKPTQEEITAYANSIGFKLDGLRFYNYYESNGWKIGRSPMKNWQAAVNTWKQKQMEDNPSASDGSKSGISYMPLLRAKREAEKLRVQSPAGEVSTGVRDMPDVPTETTERE